MVQTDKIKKFQPSASPEIGSDQERRKMFLRYINFAWLILGIVTLVGLPFFSQYRREFIILIAITIPTYVLVEILKRSGRTLLAGGFLTLMVNIAIFGLFLTLVKEMGADQAFSTQGTVWMLMGLTVLFAGALMQKWFAPLAALLNTILLFATRLTLAPSSDPRPSVIVFWWMLALIIWLYEGSISGALGRVWTELGVRKKAEEKLIGSEQRFRSLANIERALSETERVGIETILQLIVDSAKALIPGAEDAVLHLIDFEKQMLVPRAVAGINEKLASPLNMRIGEGIAGQVIQTERVIGVSDTRTDSRFLSRETPAGFRSIIVAPIKGRERCVGTISIQSGQADSFTADEGQLLGIFGTQAAIAIENANLLQTTQQDLREINALYQVSRGLAGSLDPDQLLGNVVDLLQKNFGYYHVQVYLLDNQRGELIARYGSGKIGDFLKEQEFHLPVGSGIVGHVAETGEPFMTNDVDKIVFFVRHPLLPDTQSKLSIPIKVEDQVVGVLDIQQMPPDRLTSRDMQLMTAVADQLAVALQKANLYGELQTSLRQERITHNQLIQSERLAVIGRLLASVSHELNNPLQAIQNALFLIKDEEKLSLQGRNDMEIVLSETERMAEMIKRLRAFYRPTRAEDFQDVQLNSIAVDVSALTANHMRQKNITFEFIPDLELPDIPGIPDQIRQVVLNLFMNAVEAMESGGHLTAYSRRLPGQDRILFSVTDTGPGIDPELIPHIFEPFITNKENGTGLGLTITADIIRRHNGEIKAVNNPDGGATFNIWLPKNRKAEV